MPVHPEDVLLMTTQSFSKHQQLQHNSSQDLGFLEQGRIVKFYLTPSRWNGNNCDSSSLGILLYSPTQPMGL